MIIPSMTTPIEMNAVIALLHYTVCDYTICDTTVCDYAVCDYTVYSYTLNTEHFVHMFYTSSKVRVIL